MKIIQYTIILLLLLSCGNRYDKDNKENIISVSIEPLSFFVENIAGGDFTINVVVPPGASVETYEPTIQSIKDVSVSKLFIATSLLEPEHNIINAIKDNVDILHLKNNIELITGSSCCSNAEHEHAGDDPHIWLSVKNARIITNSICDALCKLNIDSCSKYKSNRDILLSKIDSLDTYMYNKLSKLSNKNFIIYHPALGYIANEYDLTQLSIEQDGKEPSGSVIKSIIDIAKENNINAIMYQSEYSSQSVESIAKEIGAKVIKINPLSDDWLNNMYVICNAISLSN